MNKSTVAWAITGALGLAALGGTAIALATADEQNNPRPAIVLNNQATTQDGTNTARQPISAPSRFDVPSANSADVPAPAADPQSAPSAPSADHQIVAPAQQAPAPAQQAPAYQAPAPVPPAPVYQDYSAYSAYSAPSAGSFD